MSYSTVLAVFPGDRVEDIEELRNGHGTAYVLWDALVKKYIPNDAIYWLGDDGIVSKLWGLYGRQDIVTPIRAVHGLTFDRAYVRAEHFARMADDIAEAMRLLPMDAESVNHWPRLEAIFRNPPDVPAIGLHVTSVSDNPFHGDWNEEKEDYDSIDWKTAFEVYDELERVPENA